MHETHLDLIDIPKDCTMNFASIYFQVCCLMELGSMLYAAPLPRHRPVSSEVNWVIQNWRPSLGESDSAVGPGRSWLAVSVSGHSYAAAKLDDQ